MPLSLNHINSQCSEPCVHGPDPDELDEFLQGGGVVDELLQELLVDLEDSHEGHISVVGLYVQLAVEDVLLLFLLLFTC